MLGAAVLGRFEPQAAPVHMVVLRSILGLQDVEDLAVSIGFGVVHMLSYSRSQRSASVSRWVSTIVLTSPLPQCRQRSRARKSRMVTASPYFSA
jgi:hypothetical protein